MEKQIFTWVGFDQLDTMVFGFYDITLTVDLASLKKGTTLSHAVLNYEDGRIAIWQNSDEDPIYEGNLVLSVEP